MILAKLKEATKHKHDDLENTVNVMDRIFSLDDYKILLTKFYRFYAAIEPKVAQNDLRIADFDFDERRKTRLLEKDLHALGILSDVKENVRLWENLPTLDTTAKAFGSLYVMEGATLGGQVISRHLKQHLGMTTEGGAAFFNSYGKEIGPMWKSFGAALTAFAASGADDDEIIEAARRTFDSFRDCVLQPLQNGH